MSTDVDADECEHPNVRVEFDEEAAKGLNASEVRQKWPRFFGDCPDCGNPIIVYASFAHYLRGDW